MALLQRTLPMNRFVKGLFRHGFIIPSVIIVGFFASSAVYAVNYNAQINSLKNENASKTAKKSDLQTQAGTIAEQIAGLQSQIAATESQIGATKAKDAELRQAMARAEVELAAQKAVLAANIKQAYVENGMSTLEMVASSKSLSEYIDREQYRNSVQGQINALFAKIDATKKQIAQQQAEITQTLADQQSMQADLAGQRAENGRLLSLNEQQQSEINNSVATNNKKITELQRLQAIENARYNIGKVSVGGTGGYPWYNVKYPSYQVDPWGMYKRECVSYTAWKVASSGRHMPYWGGRGNAKLWDDNARAAGIPVDSTPRVGDVAVSNAGTYGHVMYVEAVHSDGTITVSQYNASWDGKYSVAKRSKTGLVFIHFR
jgi:peptidoglycan DL-endopeptidase CwlO